MNHRLSVPLLTLGVIVAVAAVTLALTTSAGASRLHVSAGTLIGLKKTALGSVLVDARGRTLYLFEKDQNGLSACNTACAAYWPPLTSHGTPHAGKGVQQSLLGLSRPHGGLRQVTYSGHPLYTFVGDRQAGQTTGEGLTNFGAGWYVLAANGHKIEKSEQPATSSTSSTSSSGYSSSYSGGY